MTSWLSPLNIDTRSGRGLRVWGTEGVVLKTLFALSEEDTRFYFELGGTW